MQPDELAIIEQLTGVDRAKIELADNGFWSRGYVIDQGRIVFKFKKSPNFSYQDEITALEYINTLNLGVHHQRVAWTSPDDSYLGLYGVVGEPLVVASKNKQELNRQFDLDSIAKQLASALRALHQAIPPHAVAVPIDEELAAWQERIFNLQNWQALRNYLTASEQTLVEHFMHTTLPTALHKLGEHLVLAHGDLYKNNLFIDQAGKVGIIDFYRLQLMDEANDFMDISNDLLREKILQYYGADDILRQKIRLRVFVRPIYLFGAFAERQNDPKAPQEPKLDGFINRLRYLIEQGYHQV